MNSSWHKPIFFWFIWLNQKFWVELNVKQASERAWNTYDGRASRYSNELSLEEIAWTKEFLSKKSLSLCEILLGLFLLICACDQTFV